MCSMNVRFFPTARRADGLLQVGSGWVGVHKYLMVDGINYLQKDVLKCLPENILNVFKTDSVHVSILMTDVLKCPSKSLDRSTQMCSCHIMLVSAGHYFHVWCTKVWPLLPGFGFN